MTSEKRIAISQNLVFSIAQVHNTLRRYDQDDVFTTKQEIANEVKSEIEKAMTAFGYTIVQTLVTDIAPDNKVKVAMNEINAAQRQRVAAQHCAEADKILVVKAAEADAEAKYLAGTGIARQRQAIINGLRESFSSFQVLLSVYACMRNVCDLSSIAP